MTAAQAVTTLTAGALIAALALVAVMHGDTATQRVRAWLGRWQELVVWLPALLAIMLVAYFTLPQIDPRAGLDGWGAVWGILQTAFGVLVAAFLAWLICATYHRELTDADERDLIDTACGIEREPGGERQRGAFALQSWQAVAVWSGHRAFFLCVFGWLLERFVP